MASDLAIPAKNKFMNERAGRNQAYVPTEIEHIANIVTHALWIIPSMVGMALLLHKSNNHSQYFTGYIYGGALVALFSVSAIFHSVFYIGRFRFLKEVLHLCDRAVIYIFIAASYTPWLILKNSEPCLWAHNVHCLVWIMAVFGILYQYCFHERYKSLETLFYVVIGTSPGIAIYLMSETTEICELAAGGVVYMTGVIFFKCDGRIPCAHAIWHVFVNVGATVHFYAVYKYLMVSREDDILGKDS